VRVTCALRVLFARGSVLARLRGVTVRTTCCVVLEVRCDERSALVDSPLCRSDC
jgi:hypothetical protein